jgi:hypothetical protein
MARRAIPSVSDDFSQVLQLLKARGLVPARPSAEMVSTARAIHAGTYSLILWRFRLRGLPDHARVFIEEIASDALQILPQVMSGFNKTTKLLIRGILENILRHIYFSDHPIEFERMNREKKWFMTIEQLCEYAKVHPIFLRTEQKFDAIGQISSLYSQLSAGVHGRTVRDLEMRIALQKIVYEQGVAAEHAESLRKCVEAANFVLGMFHREKVRAFQAEDRRIILHTMPARARQVWTDHE